MENLEQKIIKVFKKYNKPLRPGDIAKELNIESKEVSKVIKKLKEKGIIYSPKRCYYSLKE